MKEQRKRGRPAITESTRVHFKCPGDLADYVYQIMRERRLTSIADAHRQILLEHREWHRRRTVNTVQ